MKKMLLLAAALAGLAMGSAHADDKFGGFYLGGGLNYGTLNGAGLSARPFGGNVNAGYGKMIDKFYLGGEVNGALSMQRRP